jgi:catechol 2,3-dioxygenase-like lactoylglutathione lyase family enzyme
MLFKYNEEIEMNTGIRLGGIHHITAIASSAAENLAFFEKLLGLRLVKKTINFDDPYKRPNSFWPTSWAGCSRTGNTAAAGSK